MSKRGNSSTDNTLNFPNQGYVLSPRPITTISHDIVVILAQRSGIIERCASRLNATDAGLSGAEFRGIR